MHLPTFAAPTEGRLLTATAFLVPVLAVLAPLGLSPLLFVSGALAGTSLAMGRPDLLRPPRRPGRMLVLVCAALVVWGGASAFWAVDGAQAAERALRLALEMTCGLLLLAMARGLSVPGRGRVMAGFALAMVLATALLLLEGATDGLVLGALREAMGHSPVIETSYNRGATTLAILAIPGAMAVHRTAGRSMAVLFLAAVAGALLQLPGATAKLALFAAVVATGLAVLLRPRPVALGLAIVLPLAILAAPPLAGALPADVGAAIGIRLDNSSAHRFAIWRFSAERIGERPVLGWGLDNSRRIPGGAVPAEIYIGDGEPPLRYDLAHRLPLHPHNGVLQVWLELGGGGIVLAIALLLLLLLRGIAVLPGPSPVPAAAIGSLVAALLIAGLSYGIWQGWWLAALWLATVIGAATLPEHRPAIPSVPPLAAGVRPAATG